MNGKMINLKELGKIGSQISAYLSSMFKKLPYNLKQIDNIINTSRKSGMISLDHSLAGAVKSGEIEIGQAIENAKNPKFLENLLA